MTDQGIRIEAGESAPAKQISSLRRVINCIKFHRDVFYIYGAPFAFIWLPIFVPTQAMQCAFVLLVMIVYWLTECIPMSVTGLLPAVLLPAFGIIPSKTIASFYMKDIMLLFIGTMVIAAMLEKTGLHRRMAIKTLFLIGANPSKILLGMMVTTWFCSMWINNTATTIMMLPTIDAILDQLTESMDKEEHTRTRKMLGLAVAYSASIGGVATITGTGTNLILLGQMESTFHTTGGLNFGTWMTFALPLSLIMIVLAWIWMQICFLGVKELKIQMIEIGQWLRSKFRKSPELGSEIPMSELRSTNKLSATEQSIFTAITKEYERLGSLKTEEYIAAVYFFALVLLWFTREPSPGASGWGSLFRSGSISDTPATLFIALLCFMTPVFREDKSSALSTEGRRKLTFLVNWKDVEKATTWSLLFLVGGGFAVSEACKVSGLNSLIVGSLSFLNSLPPTIIIAILVVMTGALTEVTSNVAICSILMPMLAELAVQMHLNPLQIMLPTTIACSFAFMLPVATPPNAIVYSRGYLTVPEMAKCGIGVNAIAMTLTIIVTITFGNAVFGMDTFPDWANNYFGSRLLGGNSNSNNLTTVLSVLSANVTGDAAGTGL